jgi:hypothetical protein
MEDDNLKFIDYTEPEKEKIKQSNSSTVYLSCCHKRVPRVEAELCLVHGYICEEHSEWHSTLTHARDGPTKTILLTKAELEERLSKDRGSMTDLKSRRDRRQQLRQQRKTERLVLDPKRDLSLACPDAPKGRRPRIGKKRVLCRKLVLGPSASRASANPSAKCNHSLNLPSIPEKQKQKPKK